MLKSVLDYYPYYLSLHQDKRTRRLHALGQLLTIAFVGGCISTSSWYWLLLAPFIVYPFAWAGHHFYENNTPAAWKKPVHAKICDWIMLKDMLTGKLEL